MADSPLNSLTNIQFVVELLNRSNIKLSTIKVWSDSPFTGIAEGEVFFSNDLLRLRLREELDFDAGLITSYGYEIYKKGVRLFWYDDFPHPVDKTLESTFPHHKHVPPDIKHNRVPAPDMSFTHPNLAVILQEMEEL